MGKLLNNTFNKEIRKKQKQIPTLVKIDYFRKIARRIELQKMGASVSSDDEKKLLNQLKPEEIRNARKAYKDL